MSELKRSQRILRQKTAFRIIILTLSIIGIIIAILNGSSDSNVTGIILGVSGSAFVWGVVELFDFIVDVYHKYHIERAAFYRIKNDAFDKIKEVIKNTYGNIDWLKIRQIIEELWEKTATFPFENNVYCLSKEFNDYSNYFLRLFWKFIGCTSFREGDTLLDEFDYILENTIMIIEVEKANIDIASNDKEKIRDTVKKLTEIDINFNAFDNPTEIMRDGCRGNIKDSYDLINEEHLIITFKPEKDCNDYYYKLKSQKAVMTIIEVLFRRVK